MIDIAANEVNKYYGANHVLKGITFEIYSGEKIGLLGKNGSGKTTLFKIIAGEEPFESGNIFKASGKKVEMLSQIPVFGENDTSEDILRSSFREISGIYREMKKIEGDENPSILSRYGRLLEEYERLGGYETESRLDRACTGMNINDRMRKSLFSQLSGGEKTRINLACILLRRCDILLLDEPTNHLDLNSLAWLEKFLHEFPGTIVVISHDRVFLDNVVTRIIEIDNGKVDFYKGNYSYYVEEKEQRRISQAEIYENQQKKIRQLEAAAKRLHEWGNQGNNEALHKQASSIEKRIEKMDKVEKPLTARPLTEGFDSTGNASKEVVSFDCVRKSYETQCLVHNLDIKIYRNDRICLLGDNGCGKSTLMKMIMKEESCDSGEIKTSASINLAYMPQTIVFEDNDMTILDTMRYEINGSEEKTRSILAGFHFRAEDVMKKVGALSGGEKSRLKLCLMMQNKANFLLLDEPTNHLDIASREWIEKALSDFNGTLLFISHDRYFIRKFATKVWHMQNGIITRYEYGFDEYLENNSSHESTAFKNGKKSPARKAQTNENSKSRNNTPVRNREKSDLEALIAEIERELKTVNVEITMDLSNQDYSKMNALYEKKHQLEERMDILYNEWLKEY